jgi:hypothetical protein
MYGRPSVAMISLESKQAKTGKSPYSASGWLQSSFAGIEGRHQQVTAGRGIGYLSF